jgi:hypothetical protein
LAKNIEVNCKIVIIYVIQSKSGTDEKPKIRCVNGKNTATKKSNITTNLGGKYSEAGNLTFFDDARMKNKTNPIIDKGNFVDNSVPNPQGKTIKHPAKM